MTYFTIRGNALEYKELDLEIDDFIETFPKEVEEFQVFDFAIENFSMAKYWPSLDSEFVSLNNSLPIPDISKWINASLVLSPKAYRYLNEVLKPYGEFLPVKIEQENYYIFNCLTLVEADKTASEKQYCDGVEVGIKSLVFHAASVGDNLIFKCSYQHCIDLFCSERLKNIIQDFGLIGISFDKNLVNTFGLSPQ